MLHRHRLWTFSANNIFVVRGQYRLELSVRTGLFSHDKMSAPNKSRTYGYSATAQGCEADGTAPALRLTDSSLSSFRLSRMTVRGNTASSRSTKSAMTTLTGARAASNPAGRPGDSSAMVGSTSFLTGTAHLSRRLDAHLQ